MHKLKEADSLQSSAVGQSVAWGKVILFGEHSVVHGHPAIAFPLPQVGLTATATPSPGPLWLTVDIYDGPLASAPPMLAPLGATITATLELIGHRQQGLHITCIGDFPLERGLGSSAAGAASIANAILDLTGNDLPRSVRHGLVQTGERVAHGNPSGLDAYTVLSRSPIWFQAGIAENIEVNLGAPIVVADSGQPGDTHSAVGAVTEMRRTNPGDVARYFETIRDHTVAARENLKNDEREALGRRMNEVHEALRELSVSSPHLDQLVRSARDAGALGAKLTGGGRGGCVIALARDFQHGEELATELRQAGALQTWNLNPEEFEQ
ncbi:mevalonate kinase [Rothia uropygialis]|uniref:mevalonate kinase n=1 Tax=Kocuria sp. 36 TaxID=1415402 RepID=UPI0013EB5DC4|nr:mevalonate kinase [Kocuria sp. 36]